MGWFKKSCSIQVEKKCNENRRWPSRKLKTWYMWNNITVSIFPKKEFSYFDSFSWYSHLNVWFWQFWPSPNMFKTCIEIVLCQFFLFQKLSYPTVASVKKLTKWRAVFQRQDSNKYYNHMFFRILFSYSIARSIQSVWF